MKALLLVVTSVLLSVSAVLGLFSYHPTATDGYAQLRAATWRIDMAEGPFKGSCSGTFIKPHVVLTAAHCRMGDISINGHKAIPLKVDEARDLMTLFVDMDSPFVPVGKFVPVLDQKVVVVGYPFGISQYLTEGRVQGEVTFPPEVIDELGPLPKFLAVSAGVSPGNSGGGVFARTKDGSYALIGVVSRGGGIVSLTVHPEEIAKFLAPEAHP